MSVQRVSYMMCIMLIMHVIVVMLHGYSNCNNVWNVIYCVMHLLIHWLHTQCVWVGLSVVFTIVVTLVILQCQLMVHRILYLISKVLHHNDTSQHRLHNHDIRQWCRSSWCVYRRVVWCTDEEMISLSADTAPLTRENNAAPPPVWSMAHYQKYFNVMCNVMSVSWCR